METLFGALVAVAPFAVVLGLFAWTSRRERLRSDVRRRQIALTDAVHERVGAVAAPVVRRRHRGWQVEIAVPFERPAVTEALLPIVLEAFAPLDRDPRSLEIVLTRQSPPAGASTRQPAGVCSVRRESLSWT
jgi:hypothetical protein